LDRSSPRIVSDDNVGLNKALALSSSASDHHREAVLLHDLWIAGTIGMKVGIEDKKFHHLTRGSKAKTSYERDLTMEAIVDL